LERPPKPVFFEDFLELLELRPWKSLLPESCWELVHTTRDIQHYSTSEAMTTEMLQVLLHKFEQRDMDHSGCDSARIRASLTRICAILTLFRAVLRGLDAAEVNHMVRMMESEGKIGIWDMDISGNAVLTLFKRYVNAVLTLC